MRASNREERQILLLEVLAASSIFCIVAIVLYMVFQYKMFGEILEAQEALQRTLTHLGGVLETHVVGHERGRLADLIVRKTQASQDGFRHFDALFNVPIKANTLGHAERQWFADVVQ